VIAIPRIRSSAGAGWWPSAVPPEARKQDLAAWARAVLVANLEADRAEACLCIGALLHASGPALHSATIGAGY